MVLLVRENLLDIEQLPLMLYFRSPYTRPPLVGIRSQKLVKPVEHVGEIVTVVVIGFDQVVIAFLE